jgi:hypothetical protein
MQLHIIHEGKQYEINEMNPPLQKGSTLPPQNDLSPLQLILEKIQTVMRLLSDVFSAQQVIISIA